MKEKNGSRRGQRFRKSFVGASSWDHQKEEKKFPCRYDISKNSLKN